MKVVYKEVVVWPRISGIFEELVTGEILAKICGLFESMGEIEFWMEGRRRSFGERKGFAMIPYYNRKVF